MLIQTQDPQGFPFPGGITTPGLPLGEADRAIPAEHAEVPGSLAQEVHLWLRQNGLIPIGVPSDS